MKSPPPALPVERPHRRQRWAANAVIVVFVALVTIDTLPIPGRAWQTAYGRIETLLDVSGLWQGTWDLFAPQIDQQNHHIEILLRDRNSDRILSSWRSTDWSELSCLEVFLHQREVEYYDRIRNRANHAAWPALADYARHEWLATSAADTTDADHLVELIDVVTPVAPPRSPDEPAGWRRTFFPPASAPATPQEK